jgi:undecaprenyl-diphosphatase
MAAQEVKEPVKEPIKKVVNAASQAARAESAPAPERRRRATLFQFVLFGMALAFAILTIIVEVTPFIQVDLRITRAVQLITFKPFSMLMSWISWPGFNPQSIIITLIAILLIYTFGLYWEAVMTINAAVFTTVINILIKTLVQRPRPAPDLVTVIQTLNSYSFPSGHVMYYVGFFGFIWFLVFTLLKPSVKRTLMLVFFGVLIGLVGLSRIYLGEHWASDAFGSYLLGSLCLAALIQVYRWGKPRYFVRQPTARDDHPKQ